jgi:hypothetical protein
MGDPIAAKKLKRGFGQRDIAILGALSSVYMDHHAVPINIGDLKMLSFLKPETTGIDGCQKSIVLLSLHAGEKSAYLSNTQNRGKSSFILSSEDSENALMQRLKQPTLSPYGEGRIPGCAETSPEC